MRSKRPLGTWCGYKRTGGAHGETRIRRLWSEKERKDGEGNNFSEGAETTKLPRSARWSGGKSDGTAAIEGAMEDAQQKRRR